MVEVDKKQRSTAAQVMSLVSDPVFFGKGDIVPGVTLMYMGRRAPRQTWTITSVYTYDLKAESWVQTNYVHKLDDLVFFVRTGEPERCAHFAYLSYSAIWRIHV